MSAMKPATRKVFDYLKELDGKNVIAATIAEDLGLDVKQVNGIVTSAFQKKGLAVRTPATIEVGTEGETKAVKFITLTEAGMAFDPDAVEVAAE